MEKLRKPFQGTWNIIRFNWQFYFIAGLAVVFLFLLRNIWNEPFFYFVIVLIILIIATTFLSLIVSFYIYDLSGLYKLNWLNKLVYRENEKILNIHAGFDETSALLHKKFISSTLTVFDFYDPVKHTEISIKRARKAYPPFPGTVAISTGIIPMEKNSTDKIFLILSAHEIMDADERVVFFKEFLGNSKNAKQTSITNEDKLVLHYDSEDKTLTAHSKDILLITNEALGYNIKYLLKSFSFNKKTGDLRYFGYPLFEKMKATRPSEEKEWEKNRASSYTYSLLRFYRTLGKRNLIQQGYLLGDLVKIEPEQIQSKGTVIKGTGFYLSLGGQKYQDTLYWPEIPYYKIISALPSQKYKLNFSGYLCVDASSATGTPHEFDNYRPGKQFSLLSLKRPVIINEEGLPEDASSIEYIGYWMDMRLSDLLPFDYQPGE